MRKILAVYFVLFSSVWSVCADDRDNGISTIDAVEMCESYVVAKDPDAYLDSPASIQSVLDPTRMYTAYIRRGEQNHIILARSSDEGISWEDLSIYKSPESLKEYHSISMFSLGRTYFRTAKNRRRLLAKNSMLIFAGGVPLHSSLTIKSEEDFYRLTPIIDFGAYRVTGLTQLRDGRIMALFHDDGRFVYADKEDMKLRESVIYKIYSSDGGKTWTNPVIALKHNIYGLYDALIFRSPRKHDRELIIICSERSTGRIYTSFSTDEGQSWSYPEEMPGDIYGDRFNMTIVKKEIYIVYRDLGRYLDNGTPNPYYGDIMMWTGSIKDLMDVNKGVRVRIADNYPLSPEEKADYDDMRHSDCGYASVIPISGDRLSVVAYGRWDKEHLPYIRNFILDTKGLKRARHKR